MTRKFCFFDLYFTLFDPIKTITHGEEECDILGITGDVWESACASIYGQRALGELKDPESIVRAVCKELAMEVTESQIDQLLAVRLNRFRRTAVEVDEKIMDGLKQLVDQGMRLCLISNADCIDKMFFHESPVAKYFEHVVFSCDVGSMKPDAEIFEKALAVMHARAEESIFVGDGGHNELKGARSVGFRTALTTYHIRNYWPEAIEDLSVNADVVIDDFAMLIDKD